MEILTKNFNFQIYVLGLIVQRRFNNKPPQEGYKDNFDIWNRKTICPKLGVFQVFLFFLVMYWPRILEHRSWFFGCCTADSQAGEDQNQLNNNLKIDFGAPKSGDSYELMKELHQSPTDLKSGLRRWPFLLCHYCNFIMVYFILSH